MPTGRPDYWYGTALYFEDNPADGEVTRGPTSNWAYDHNATVDAHHAKYTDAEALAQAESIIDDTPDNGDTTHSPSSNWAFDHDAAVDAHHAKYTDADAVSAMGAKGDGNPLHHDKAVDADIDHGSIGGLADDDHTQYLSTSVERASTAMLLLNIDGYFMRVQHGGANKIGFLCRYGSNEALRIENHVLGSEIFRVDVSGDVTLAGTVDGIDIAAHDADASAHHARYDPEDETIIGLGKSVVAGGSRQYSFHAAGDATLTAYFKRNIGVNGDLYFFNTGTGSITFYPNSSRTVEFVSGGGSKGLYCYVDRGDPASADFDEGDLTEDATWRDLDLSGVVPAEGVSVHLRITIQHATGMGYIMFRENGNANGFNASLCVAQVATVNAGYDVTVRMDANRIIEYYATINPQSITITVAGWWV